MFVLGVYGGQERVDTGSPGTVVIDEYEPSGGCQEANPGPLQERPVL